VKQSPLIEHLEWGKITIAGFGSGKDMKLYPGGAREWDWNETGTRHNPGIQPTDVQELLDRGSEVIVLSRGMHLVLKTSRATLEILADQQVPVHVLETREAAQLYNGLATNHRVGGLFHSTC
jgi:hypothetical protein